MSIEVFKAAEHTTTNWSGGTTTELFIGPKTGSYKAREFDFRLSTATVEIPTSVFTPLPGVTRTLMVLEGEMTLKHEGHHEKKLKALESDYFQGEWTTHSEGECIDFNLMTRNDTSGLLKGLSLEENESCIVDPKQSSHFFLYLFEGALSVESGGIQNDLTKNDLYCGGDLKELLNLKAEEACKAVLVFIA